jgi:polyhydroxyalkanoate synthesis regulator phasin
MSKRKNTFTRFIEDIVDDSKDFVDDILDRAKDLENNARDAVKDVVDDDESDDKVSTSTPGVAELQAALAELTAKVNQLAELQLASASVSSTAKTSTRSAAA